MIKFNFLSNFNSIENAIKLQVCCDKDFSISGMQRSLVIKWILDLLCDISRYQM